MKQLRKCGANPEEIIKADVTNKDELVNAMKGDIKASNVEYSFNGKNYKGACFRITIPI